MLPRYTRTILLWLLFLSFSTSYGANRLVTLSTDVDPANPAVGSLRWAVESGVAGDTVSFPENGSVREILLSGSLLISQPLTIIGPASFELTIKMTNSASSEPMLAINGMTRPVRIEHVTFSGSGLGALTAPDALIIIGDGAELSLSNCQLEDYDIGNTNSSAIIAGFLVNEGRLRLDSCVVARNFPAGVGDYVIENKAGDTLEIYHSTLLLNQSLGAGIILNRGWMDFQNNNFLFNGSPSGEIRNEVGASANIYSSFFEGNIEAGLINQGNMWVDSCQFVQNFGSHGVAIENEDSLFVNHCLFSNNSTTNEGGAILQTSRFGYMSVEASTFEANQAAEGGAIYAAEGHLDIENCTFSKNVAEVKGGAIRKENANINLVHSTFVENISNIEGGAIFSQSVTILISSNRLMMSNCLFLGNKAVIYPDIRSIAGVLSPFDISLGYNIVEDTVNTGVIWDANDILGVANLASLVPLGELAENGGPTPTYALEKDSLGNNLALDAGGPSGIAIDQRGIPRTGISDIGAFEYSEVKITAPDNVICLGDAFFELDSIIIEDPNGGAMLPGKNLALILGLSPGLVFDAQSGAASSDSGSGIEIRDMIVGTTNLTLLYDRSFSTNGGRMYITGLKVQTPVVGEGQLFRIGGNASMIGNDMSDSLSHADISMSASVIQPDFLWKNICESQQTEFSDESVLILGKAAYWQWDFGDPASGSSNVASDSVVSHLFSDVGSYNVQLIVGSNEFCLDTIIQEISILDTLRISEGNPYDQSFENEAGWVTEGINSSWEWGVPNGAVLQTAPNRGRVWATNLSGSYNENENSWVNSPCLDLSALKRPIWRMDIFSHTQEGFDGAVLQFSRDGGLSWENVGGILEGDSTGINWYDEEAIIGNPGEQLTTKVGWSSETPFWRRVSHELDTIVRNSPGLLRFRIAFGSDGSQPADVLEGFAFDHVFIGEKSRQILLEHFVNTTAHPNFPDTVQLLHEQSSGDAWTIQYHLDTPEEDPIFSENRMDHSGRGLYYGISRSGLTIVDGNVYHGPPEDLSSTELGLRSLRQSQFDIEIDTTQGEVQVRSAESWVGELLVHMAIVEDGLPHPEIPGKRISHVMRKMLPSAAGTYLEGPLPAGFTIRLNPTWSSADNPSPSIVQHPDSLRLIVWLQEPESKEILQVAASTVSSNMISVRDVKEEEQVHPGSTIFPNPASRFLYVYWKENPPEKGSWTMNDLQGRVVLRGNLRQGQEQMMIPLENIPAGMYLLTIERPGFVRLQEQIIVRN